MKRLAFAAAVTLSVSSSAAAQDPVRTFSLGSIGNQCIDFTDVKQGTGPGDYRQCRVSESGTGPGDYRQCRVSESGQLGNVGDEAYYYAIYCVMPVDTTDNGNCGDSSFSARYHRARGLAIFAGAASDDHVRLSFERAEPEIGTVYYLKPEIIAAAAGLVLYLPVAIDGTSAGNESEYYLRSAEGWERLDSESWHADLLKRLDAGLQIWKGIWPDLRTMRAEAGLYRKDDTNCCPTGGVARIQLAIRDRRFVLESVEIDRLPR